MRSLHRFGVAIAASTLLLMGCTPGEISPAATVTVTVSPPPGSDDSPEAPELPEVGDDLTKLEAWDLCFSRTQTETGSDMTEWSRYSPDLVSQVSPWRLEVTIENVRQGGLNDDSFMHEAFGTVNCAVEGRVGAVVVVEWTRTVA
jgi:hypothetical protein